ncbi:hypothetical protein [Urechidicola vernalis]|uniref:GLPGLI family protein n=1 Tax=Urechidicola vernalis TaxID=3075600 RepID=A0ABU2Y5D8_9FLAO|nr:hypothetical protein [Urechidicola sp. P050]MDT0553416.1 hypothetical protein [Urechidicola sp. P050]
MKRVILISMALLMCNVLVGQRNDNSKYWITFEYKAKEGMVQKFMEAAAEKTTKFNSNPDHSMMTYRVITGRNSGTFVRVQSSKSPADFDKDRSAEGEYWNENVGKYIGENIGRKHWVLLDSGSYNSDPENTTPKKFVEWRSFDVKPSGILHFRRFMYRIAKTLEKREVEGTRFLYRLVSGGNRNLFVVVMPFDTFKRSNQQEFENSFRDDYNELHGYGTFDEDQANFDNSLENWGEMIETLQLEPSMTTGMMNK